MQSREEARLKRCREWWLTSHEKDKVTGWYIAKVIQVFKHDFPPSVAHFAHRSSLETTGKSLHI
jgi:hypothetical protein